jgi:thiamine-monophosphate kinase
MGAEPAWALLTLTLPRAEPDWLRAFAAGLHELARRHGTALVGGDTTAGALTATVAIAGFVPPGQALRRVGARPGDEIWVSGTPGDAAAGLQGLLGRLDAPEGVLEPLKRRFARPEPRIGLGLLLRGVATACIDVSDGLAGDLAKLCVASGVAGRIDSTLLPRSAAMRAALDPEAARRLVLGGGDDYELLFTLPPGTDGAVLERAAGVTITRIGEIIEGSGLQLDGAPVERALGHGFDHFG